MKTLVLFLLAIHISVLQAQDLFKLVRQNDYEGVKSFQDAVNLRDTNQATVLMWAAYTADLPMVELLVKKGADVHAKGWIIWQDPDTEIEYIYGSMMAIAAGENKPDLLKYLLKRHKIPVDDKEINLYEGLENGWTALQWAAVKGNTNILSYLAKEGADINLRAETDFDQTPLMFAVISDQAEAANQLIKLGAGINAIDKRGNTALFYAFETGNREIVRTLLKHGALFKNSHDQEIDDKLMETFGVESANEL
jgi:ankyrin repeat protein